MDNKNSGLIYCGINDMDFKIRLHNHRRFFHNLKCGKDTELSKYTGNLKDQIYLIKWSFQKQTSELNTIDNPRSLCLSYYLFACL